MGKLIELPGVKTWYEVEGNGDPLLLLHAMFCSNETWAAQRPDLSAVYQVFLPERRAHGHTGDVAGPLSYHDMASDTIDFLTLAVAKPAHLVGFSDGAIVALLVAIARPDLVRKLVVIGGNFDVSGLLPEASGRASKASHETFERLNAVGAIFVLNLNPMAVDSLLSDLRV